MDKQIEVSELFLDIFKLFNVSDQRERMKQLTKKELYYLLLCSMDNHNEDDPIVIINFSDFELEINEILEFQESEKTTNEYLLELVKETEDSWISTTVIELPTPYTRDEVRDLKLGGILD
jgi:Fe-S-cluster formation regulator IscX/YfhJ